MSEITQANVGTGKRHIHPLSIVGLALALAAFVGASCCALPLVLASLGLAGAWIANLEVFVVYRAYFTVTALALIVLGWTFALRRQSSARTFLILGLATVTVFAALVITQYDGEISRYLVSLRRK
jgi:mercuric ion transport protein